MRHRGIPMSQINPSTMKGPGDFDPPDDPPGCPECDEPMEVHAHSAECSACGHVDEPDVDEPDDDFDDGRCEALHWGGMDGY